MLILLLSKENGLSCENYRNLTNQLKESKFTKALSFGLVFPFSLDKKRLNQPVETQGFCVFGVQMENTKICFKCNQEKPLNEFYAHPAMTDGRVNKCKECNKKDVRKSRKAKLEYYQEYDRQRAMLPHRVEARKIYAESHPEVIRRCKLNWAKNNKEKLLQIRKKYINNNPEKRSAHIKVGNALRSGVLVKEPCEVCGSKDVHGHHDDYSKPLDVRWLCPKHHSEHHKNMKIPF